MVPSLCNANVESMLATVENGWAQMEWLMVTNATIAAKQYLIWQRKLALRQRRLLLQRRQRQNHTTVLFQTLHGIGDVIKMSLTLLADLGAIMEVYTVEYVIQESIRHAPDLKQAQLKLLRLQANFANVAEHLRMRLAPIQPLIKLVVMHVEFKIVDRHFQLQQRPLRW